MAIRFIFFKTSTSTSKCRWSILDVVLLEDVDNSYINISSNGRYIYFKYKNIVLVLN